METKVIAKKSSKPKKGLLKKRLKVPSQPKRKKVYPPQYFAYRNMINEITNLKNEYRFCQKSIPVYKICSQFYCERKLDFELRKTPLQSEEAINIAIAHQKAINTGKAGHIADLPFIQTETEENIWCEAFRPNRRKPCSVREFEVSRIHDGVPIVGAIDKVVFYRGKILSLFEFKFRPSMRIYDTDRIQGQIYALLLQGLGFDTSEMIIKAVCFHPDEKQFALRGRDFVSDKKSEDIKFSSTTAIEYIDWALQYWKSKREAVPTTQIVKCKKCEYFESCNDSPLKISKKHNQIELPL